VVYTVEKTGANTVNTRIVL